MILRRVIYVWFAVLVVVDVDGVVDFDPLLVMVDYPFSISIFLFVELDFQKIYKK
jgi:hypothetical protein